MKCGGCESGLQDKLLAVDGVISATASHQNNTVDIEYDETVTNLGVFKQVVTGAGYTVE